MSSLWLLIFNGVGIGYGKANRFVGLSHSISRQEEFFGRNGSFPPGDLKVVQFSLSGRSVHKYLYTHTIKTHTPFM